MDDDFKMSHHLYLLILIWKAEASFGIGAHVLARPFKRDQDAKLNDTFGCPRSGWRRDVLTLLRHFGHVPALGFNLGVNRLAK